MENYLIRALAYDGQARILFAELTDLARDIIHKAGVTGRLPRLALGTVISVASLLSGTLKEGQRLTLKVKASRPDLMIFADVDALGNVRGYLSDGWKRLDPQDQADSTLPDIIGECGSLQIIKALSIFQNYTGVTDMPHGNIVDDLAHYFRQSEQTLTCFVSRVAVDSQGEVILCQGVMAQLLPGASEDLIDRIKVTLDHWQPGHGLPTHLFEDLEVLGTEPIQAFCGCSKEMFYPMLLSLGLSDLTEAVEQHEPIVFICQACAAKYAFSPAEIEPLVTEKPPG